MNLVIGEEEYDEIRVEEKKRERALEETVRREIARRRKENCKRRGKEIHEKEELGESKKQKRRKLNEDGKYKTVVQMTTIPENLKRHETSNEKKSKRMRITEHEHEEEEEQVEKEQDEKREEVEEKTEEEKTESTEIQSIGTRDQRCSIGGASRLAEKEKGDTGENKGGGGENEKEDTKGKQTAKRVGAHNRM